MDNEEKYINPFTDFGFKRIFGEEPNKDLLMDFLNELLREEQGEIVSLTYLKNEPEIYMTKKLSDIKTHKVFCH